MVVEDLDEAAAMEASIITPGDVEETDEVVAKMK